MATSGERETRERLRKENYRASTGAKTCAACAHMEILESGALKGICFCRPMRYHFNESVAEAHICNRFMRGTQEDGLIEEMAALIVEMNHSAAKNKSEREEKERKLQAEREEKKRKLQAEREECTKKLSQQTGLFAGMRRSSLQKRIAQIEKELAALK